MAAFIPLSDDDIAWVKSYEAEVVAGFTSEFRESDGRFAHWQRLVDRFAGAVDAVLKNGRPHFRAVDEAHNELCVASAILSNSEPRIAWLEYEPALPGCARSIDFRATADSGAIFYVDVKTIKPQPKDRWEQFERAVNEGWFPENVKIILSKDGLGGELWHNMFTARSRMLEYTIEFEEKIAEGNLTTATSSFILALCGTGFHWRETDLQDFVHFYYRGTHRADDPFSLAEQRDMTEKNISLKKTISSFAYVSRLQGTVRHKHLNWRVQSSPEPFLL